MEIGSFIGLDLKNSGEYYPGETGIARLNSARAGIYHACRLLNCSNLYFYNQTHHLIKRIGTDGIIHTLAGGGTTPGARSRAPWHRHVEV